MIRESMRMVEAGIPLPPQRATMARAQVAYSCQLVLGAAHAMRDAMGSGAVYLNPTERQYRNILAGAQHVAVNWPRAAALWGAALFEA